MASHPVHLTGAPKRLQPCKSSCSIFGCLPLLPFGTYLHNLTELFFLLKVRCERYETLNFINKQSHFNHSILDQNGFLGGALSAGLWRGDPETALGWNRMQSHKPWVFFNKLLTVIQLHGFSLTLQKKLPAAMHIQALSLLQKVKLSPPE